MTIISFKKLTNECVTVHHYDTFYNDLNKNTLLL